MKNKITAGVLALFVGGIGIHKFYLNRPFQGLIYLFLCWTFIPSFIAFFEALVYFFQSEETFNLKYNQGKSTRLNDPVEDMKNLAALHESGHLSKEEFESKKQLLLDKIK